MRAEVVDAVAKALRDLPGNPSSVHAAGRAARADRAGAKEVAALGASAERSCSSGGTEANASLQAHRARPPPDLEAAMVSSARAPVGARIAREDVDVSLVAVGPDARSASGAAGVVRPGTVLVTLALANHDSAPVRPGGPERDRARGRALFHADAVRRQARSIDVGALGSALRSSPQNHGRRDRGDHPAAGVPFEARRAAGTGQSDAPARRPAGRRRGGRPPAAADRGRSDAPRGAAVG